LKSRRAPVRFVRRFSKVDSPRTGEINQSVNQLQADYTNELILYR
jgi:hypothetical protein